MPEFGADHHALARPQLIDLRHLGRRHVIGAWLVGEVLIDPGPSSCLEALLEAIGTRVPRVLALTHIHLDHAGASGSLLRRFPDAEVWVHERGAPHLVDPTRLLASARRLYGGEMARLWGEVLPVPVERVRALAGGETLGQFHVLYAPGHASHHVCYLHEPSRRAFTGDVAGVRIGDGPVLPPTPPPDIDLAAWHASLGALGAWAPSRLAVTHFGCYDDVPAHLEAMRGQLRKVRDLALRADEHAFSRAIRRELERGGAHSEAAAYEQAMPPEQSYQGLRRYLRGRAEAGGAHWD